MSLMDSKIDIPALVSQLNALRPADFKDDTERKSLYEAARAATFTSETSQDSIHRIANASVQTTAAKIARDLGLFGILGKFMGKSDEPLPTVAFADLTWSDSVLVGRILRCLASFGMIKEVGQDLWDINEITHALWEPEFRAGIDHSNDVLLPCLEALPDFLRKTKYQNPRDPAHTSFQEAFKTQMPAFEWAGSSPKTFNDVNLRMTNFYRGETHFLDFYRFEEKLCKGVRPEDILLVDVGGGSGRQCVAFKERLSHVPGRVINQDQAPVTSQVFQCAGVEHESHDFTKDQPLQGARAYYLRNVLHNHPDDKCVSILWHIIRAMNQDSVILIDEIVIPNEGANWRQTQLDLAMMATLAGMERTEGQWRRLLARAGLVITEICSYEPEFGDSIIEAVPSQSELREDMGNGQESTREVIPNA